MYSGFCTYMFVLSVFYFVLHCEQPRCSPHYLSTFRTNYVASVHKTSTNGSYESCTRCHQHAINCFCYVSLNGYTWSFRVHEDAIARSVKLIFAIFNVFS